MTSELTYASYLKLDQLLSLQKPVSKPEEPDELLFIVVHQSSELWFKAILNELEGLSSALVRQDEGQALWRLQRLNALVRIVSSQLAALETLPPQHFARLRANLGTSSGVQSTQFRSVEATSARLEDQFLQWLFAKRLSIEELYLGPGPRMLYFVAEGLLEYEQQFSRWRFTHVQLVERVIGPMTKGTGGTAGAGYLKRSVDERFFPRLWEARVRLV
jgi:tryptophan 2,3-dioxygenase